MMNKFSILSLFFFLFSFLPWGIPGSLLFADKAITRGPDVGEIYFIGPTVTGEGIYRSTDFGETAICMDSTLNTNINFGRITADLTPGVLYAFEMPENLYISYDYGQEGSWIFRGNISKMSSGRTEGHIYDGIARHSEDYGYTFINHSCLGFFGNYRAKEIDNEDQIAYALVYESDVLDSLWLLISYDDFDNLEIQHVFNFGAPIATLSRGYEEGELYLYTYYWGIGDGRKLRYSNDYGVTWDLKNTFNCPNLPIRSIVGGRQPGELYILVEYIQNMGFIKHTYIYQSLDYGETFTIYHPFAYGEDPIYANFEASPIEGPAPLTVQFTDLSNGNVLSTWEWDFQNDGIIDSYEQNPEYTYQDTGHYSVSLSIHPLNYNPATRYDYIHVTNGSGADNYELEISNYQLNNYPNPFNPTTTIEFSIEQNQQNEQIELIIFNLKGQRLKTFTSFPNPDSSGGTREVIWYGKDNNNKKCSSGIYFYKIKAGKRSKVKKMLLLK